MVEIGSISEEWERFRHRREEYVEQIIRQRIAEWKQSSSWKSEVHKDATMVSTELKQNRLYVRINNAYKASAHIMFTDHMSFDATVEDVWKHIKYEMEQYNGIDSIVKCPKCNNGLSPIKKGTASFDNRPDLECDGCKTWWFLDSGRLTEWEMPF
jgi:hypothetical protein